jgi:Ca-activated chloride channel family protein
MKKINKNFEKNISRLMKRTKDTDKPSQAFIDSVTEKAMHELTSKTSAKPMEDKIMKFGIKKLLTAAALFAIVCVITLAMYLPSLNKVKRSKEDVIAHNAQRTKMIQQNLALQQTYDTPPKSEPKKIVAMDAATDVKTNRPIDKAQTFAYKKEAENTITAPMVVGKTFQRVKTLREQPVVRQPMAHGGTAPPNAQPVDAMFFHNYGVNPFIDTEDDHLSTFATDVDTGSYTITRSYLHDGHLPPNDSVRVEEFVNYFKYNYPAPQQNTFALYTEMTPWPFTTERKNTKLLRIGLKAKKISDENRKPAVLTFVIDVSGSMNRENRLGLVKKSLRMLLDNLKENDLVGISVYGTNGRTVMPHKTIADKSEIISAIESLQSEGSTNAEEGIRIGYEMAQAAFKENAINRVILCSDGVANVGRTGADGILEVIKNKAQNGITLSSIGFGMGNYNDVMLERLGDKGNGSYAYIDTITEAKRIFADNLTATLQVVARDAKVQVDFNPAVVRSYRLIGYENRDVPDDKFRDDKYDGGEVGAGHSATALYELKLWPGKSGKIATTYIRYKHADTFEPTEFNNTFTTDDMQKSITDASDDFKLAASTMQFAEILRKSSWAKKCDLGEVLTQIRNLGDLYTTNPDIIELTDLISKAQMLINTTEPAIDQKQSK